MELKELPQYVEEFINASEKIMEILSEVNDESLKFEKELIKNQCEKDELTKGMLKTIALHIA
ncbi:hypothetical protein U8V72_25760, partial [Priestia filamentosa]|uniref:hypothetical protein n=1 Tax=Priestia filamentosa TaxID=1402861 RepID=UPI00397B1206